MLELVLISGIESENQQVEGMSEQVNPPIRLLAAFEQFFGSDAPDLVVAAPGRACWAAVRFNGTTHYQVVNGDKQVRVKFDQRSARHKQTLLGRPIPRWARYAAGVTVSIQVRMLPGADVVIISDEPPGIRTEHSVGILMAALWHEVNGETLDEQVLFQIAEQARREYIERN